MPERGDDFSFYGTHTTPQILKSLFGHCIPTWSILHQLDASLRIIGVVSAR